MQDLTSVFRPLDIQAKTITGTFYRDTTSWIYSYNNLPHRKTIKNNLGDTLHQQKQAFVIDNVLFAVLSRG